MRHHLRLQALLPALASAALASACGGTVSPVGGESSSGSSGASSSGSSSGASGSSGASSSSGSSGTSGAASGSSGTSGASSGSSGTTGTFDLNVCTGTEHKLLEGVTAANGTPSPGGAVEYLELRDEYGAGTGQSTPNVLAQAGTPCANAADKGLCQQNLAALRSATGWTPVSFGLEPGQRHRYLVSTMAGPLGNNPGTITNLDDLRDFVQPTENVKDAAFLATATSLYRFVCDGTKNAMKTPAGWELLVQSGHDCGSGTHIDEHVVEVTTSGVLTVKSTKLLKKGDPGCAIGRRPEGLIGNDCGGGQTENAVGRFFAEAAHLEAASVVAFERLAEELIALGAPAELIACARVSREDEVRHARMTARAALRFGAPSIDPPEVTPARQRTAFEIALENAVEGCVRETYGALVAHHQAAAAKDRSIACMLQSIAEDETRHAGLAWEVATWLEPQLSEADRQKVAAARAEAIRELRDALHCEPETDLQHVAGMPNAATAIAMLDGLDAGFLSVAA